MTKRQLIKKLQKKYDVKRTRFKPYDLILHYNTESYHIKILRITPTDQLTINSKYVWNRQKGKRDGARFIVKRNDLIYMNKVFKQSNPIILCTNKPFKVLKYINESEVINISEKKVIHKIPFLSSISDIDAYIQ
ncbi:MAG: hypothetical protein K9L74_03220 [Candidatus Izimaplasma sp.]|nr:hypothetical protein [Candidatus Izimaplasma bacterium]